MKEAMYLLAFLSTGLALTSCSSDDDANTHIEKNHLKVESTEHELVYGISEDYGDDAGNEIYNIDLTFITSEFTVDGSNYDGNGYGVYFEIFSSTPHKLAPGTYHYNDSQSTLSFDYGDYLDYSLESQEEEMDINIVSGTITVLKSETEYYELTFNCIDKLGRSVTGRYYGEVHYASNIEP